MQLPNDASSARHGIIHVGWQKKKYIGVCMYASPMMRTDKKANNGLIAKSIKAT
jgi:hypothetical protein